MADIEKEDGTVFAKAALEAYKLCVNDVQLDPVEAWKKAIAFSYYQGKSPLGGKGGVYV